MRGSVDIWIIHDFFLLSAIKGCFSLGNTSDDFNFNIGLNVPESDIL